MRVTRGSWRRQTPAIRLVVDVDGQEHDGSIDDLPLSERLMPSGFSVLRFANDAVRVDLDRGCERIFAGGAVARAGPLIQGPRESATIAVAGRTRESPAEAGLS